MEEAGLDHLSYEWRAALFKTQLCKHFASGSCPLGEACRFAHGTDDLRVRPELEKTSLCYSVLKGFACARGNQCTYAHSFEELNAARAAASDPGKKRPPMPPPPPSEKESDDAAKAAPAHVVAMASKNKNTFGVRVEPSANSRRTSDMSGPSAWGHSNGAPPVPFFKGGSCSTGDRGNTAAPSRSAFDGRFVKRTSRSSGSGEPPHDDMMHMRRPYSDRDPDGMMWGGRDGRGLPPPGWEREKDDREAWGEWRARVRGRPGPDGWEPGERFGRYPPYHPDGRRGMGGDGYDDYPPWPVGPRSPDLYPDYPSPREYERERYGRRGGGYPPHPWDDPRRDFEYDRERERRMHGRGPRPPYAESDGPYGPPMHMRGGGPRGGMPPRAGPEDEEAPPAYDYEEKIVAVEEAEPPPY
uniref:C3H1-type domain-containing protein n=1 Tax=Chromera velia CCMP2878 TaxID=1169474 RepID=A0A0G4FDN4_9ALVE|eukprot:Cvel_16489.t1-p1 / transcript=Cvel_16489.t1 / gene=Cvel_16489 / organism=Chromera_velia_CCMP2878 / gene_product=Zinc finger CCCH domain-containing protein 39, putative / transcript_product=Zinc finger CCCH domain-containing protein 39, putative / location=Cvel_scaffold1271:41490-44902(-) / protein_length=411 / sequence_SO=supercontig / SO=protein_coding / is_pseudo=false